MEKKRVGIIGCGGIANGKHLPVLSKMPDVEVVAFCDLIQERAEQAAKKYGSHDALVCTDYRELLADRSIDNVRVLTQNSAHCQITVDALDAGKHVLVEKPMCITPDEAQKMLAARDRSGKILAVGYQHKFDPDVVYMKKEIEDGALGEIYFAKCRVVRRRGVPTWGVFTQKKEQGAGPLFDIATHALDEALYMMDNYKPKLVVGSMYDKLKDQPICANPFGAWDVKKFDVEDSAFGFIVMQNGATIMLESSWLLNTCESNGGVNYLLCGTRAGADNYSGKLRLNTVKHDRMTEEFPNFSTGGVAFFEGGAGMTNAEAEQRNFIDATQGKVALVNTAERAAVVTNILYAIMQSAQTGKAICFDKGEL